MSGMHAQRSGEQSQVDPPMLLLGQDLNLSMHSAGQMLLQMAYHLIPHTGGLVVRRHLIAAAVSAHAPGLI